MSPPIISKFIIHLKMLFSCLISFPTKSILKALATFYRSRWLQRVSVHFTHVRGCWDHHLTGCGSSRSCQSFSRMLRQQPVQRLLPILARSGESMVV